ncbi:MULTISPECIES: hypothetical protein [unclassified Streptomyces]|uniref:hypothetical protein n=1 Tax=unclassified Streptomyces TaxID=2593676 RepID=UPI002DDACBE9|nr:hypothetical protein [Streptomyces sp. NBC_01768]WSC32313.1 hypothetical protein OG902_39640 [Streptomyces sp. NBC_01768]WSX06361.1 hypothetical protein OG355_41295 [Streptomyces sp. NBC_00987]
MHCTHTDLSGSTRSKCGTAEFALTVSAMLTVDLSGEEQDHTVDLDGLAHEDIDLVCKKCGNPLEGPEFVKVVTLLILKLEKRLGAGMAPFSSYTFNDGTVIHPDQLQVTPLRDVTAGPAYQNAVKQRARYEQWLARQQTRVNSGEIHEMDLRVMCRRWHRSIAGHHVALLDELAS